MLATIAIIALLVIVIALCVVLYIVFSESKKLKAKYAPIVNIEEQYSKIKNEIEQYKKNEYSKIKNNIDQLSATGEKTRQILIQKIEKLKDEYKKSYSTYQNITKEIKVLTDELTLLEENMEMLEHGIYKPHFDYGDSDEYRHKLEELRDDEKKMIREGSAVSCEVEWMVGDSKAEGKKMTKQIQKLMSHLQKSSAEVNLPWNR